MVKAVIVTYETTDFEQATGQPKERTDIDPIATHLKELEELEKNKKFGEARRLLEHIKELLDKSFDWSEFNIWEKNCRTLIAVHKMLKSDIIRLRYKSMDINGYFKLLENVKKRLYNKVVPVAIQRRVVAEEMAKLNLYPQMLFESWEVKEDKAPNRAFMDILLQIKPELAKHDIERRENTKQYLKERRQHK
jgi:hypothetical protein